MKEKKMITHNVRLKRIEDRISFCFLNLYISVIYIQLLMNFQFSFRRTLLSSNPLPLPLPLPLPFLELFRAVEAGPPPLRSALAPLLAAQRYSIPSLTRSWTVGQASSDFASCSPPRRFYSSLGSNPVECYVSLSLSHAHAHAHAHACVFFYLMVRGF